MTFEEFTRIYSLGEANLLHYELTDKSILISAEIVRGNQPKDVFSKPDTDLIPVEISISAPGGVESNVPFTGLGVGQDGEVSYFGPKKQDAGVETEGAKNFELSFFLHDYSRPSGDTVFIVLWFSLVDIDVQLS